MPLTKIEVRVPLNHRVTGAGNTRVRNDEAIPSSITAAPLQEWGMRTMLIDVSDILSFVPACERSTTEDYYTLTYKTNPTANGALRSISMYLPDATASRLADEILRAQGVQPAQAELFENPDDLAEAVGS